MEELNFPKYDFSIKESEGKKQIYDSLRKKYLILTPEEWVRQHIVHYFLREHDYPRSLCKLEGGIQINKLPKRVDVLFYDRKGEPFMLIECKAPSIKLTDKVFEQAAIYNLKVKAKYIFLTNGKQHLIFSYQNNGYKNIIEIPAFPQN